MDARHNVDHVLRIAGKVQFYLKMGEEIPNEFQMI